MKNVFLQIPIRAIALDDEQHIQRAGFNFKNDAIIIANAESVRVIAGQPFREGERVGLRGVKEHLLYNPRLNIMRQFMHLLPRLIAVHDVHGSQFNPQFFHKLVMSDEFPLPDLFSRMCEIACDDIDLDSVVDIRAGREIKDGAQREPLLSCLLLRRGLELRVGIKDDLGVHMHVVYTRYIRRQARKMSSIVRGLQWWPLHGYRQLQDNPSRRLTAHGHRGECHTRAGTGTRNCNIDANDDRDYRHRNEHRIFNANRYRIIV